MGTLQCTFEESHKFIDPKVRNDVQYLTKKRKRSLDYRCENCGKKGELQAAHIGLSRKQMIEKVLRKYLDGRSGTTIRVDLAEVRKEILEAHTPMEQYVRMLCVECNRKLDAKAKGA